MIGYAFCGSFCTFEDSFKALKIIKNTYEDIVPIMSNNAYMTDTRFGSSREWIDKIEQLCGNEIIHTVKDTEPFGPKIKFT